jgi:hypothetical protein
MDQRTDRRMRSGGDVVSADSVDARSNTEQPPTFNLLLKYRRHPNNFFKRHCFLKKLTGGRRLDVLAEDKAREAATVQTTTSVTTSNDDTIGKIGGGKCLLPAPDMTLLVEIGDRRVRDSRGLGVGLLERRRRVHAALGIFHRLR